MYQSYVWESENDYLKSACCVETIPLMLAKVGCPVNHEKSMDTVSEVLAQSRTREVATIRFSRLLCLMSCYHYDTHLSYQGSERLPFCSGVHFSDAKQR